MGDELSIDIPGPCPCGTAPQIIGLSKTLGRFTPAQGQARAAGGCFVYACTKRGTNCVPIRLAEQAEVAPACAHNEAMHLVLVPA